MSGGSVPKGYQPTGQAGADQNYQQLWSALMPWASQIPGFSIGNAQNLAQQQLNNPYSAGAQNWANQAGQYATGTLSPMLQQMSGGLQGAGNQALQAGGQILQQGFDPQNALYGQQYGQMLDQQNAINAMSGVSGSPYGAGVTGQAAQNFNLGWGNNQLGREALASGAYGGLNQTANMDFAGSQALGQGATNAMYEGGQLPSMAYNQDINNKMGGLQNLSSIFGMNMGADEGLMSSLAQYLGIGQNATALAQNAAQQNWMQQVMQMQGLGNMFGQAMPFMLGG